MDRYCLALAFLLLATTAHASCPAQPDVSGVVNVKMCGAKGDGTTPNNTAFASALALAGSAGTVYLPKGTYVCTASCFAMTKANCNVSIRGDSQGGTYLKPNFSNGSAISYIDSAAETPPDCHGTVRDVSFIAPASVPTSLNLMRASNILGISFLDTYAANFNGAGDNMFNLDAGSSPTTTFTERTTIINARSMFNTNFVTLDGKSVSMASLNNNEILGSHCDPAGTGSCINIINMANAGVLGGDYFEFNADLNAAGQSVVSDTHRADDLNGSAEFHVRAQSTVGGTNYCFNAPASTGAWTVNKYQAVQCIGPAMVLEKNGNGVRYLGEIGIQPQDYGAKGDGVTDDTAAIQAAWAGAQLVSGYPNEIFFPWTGHNYIVSQLNFTNLQYGPRLVGQNASRSGSASRIQCKEASANTGVCLDFTGSWYWSIENLNVVDDATDPPLVTVLVAKSNAGNYPGNSQIINIRDSMIVNANGSYALYDAGGEVSNINNNFFYGLIVITGSNTAGVTSPFATIHTAPISMTTTQWRDNNYTCLPGKGECILLDSGTGGAAATISGLNIDGGYVNQQTPGFVVVTGTGGVAALNISNIRDEPQGGVSTDYFFASSGHVENATMMNDVFANTVQPTVVPIQFNDSADISVAGLLTNFRPGDQIATYPTGSVISCTSAVGSTFWSVDKSGGGALPTSCSGLNVVY